MRDSRTNSLTLRPYPIIIYHTHSTMSGHSEQE